MSETGFVARRRVVSSYGWTTLFCLAIALLLFLVVGQPIIVGALVSLCIGWSITSAFLFLEPMLDNLLPPWLLPIPVTFIGLLLGLLLAGALVLDEPYYFFTDGFESLYLGIFFGAVGYLVLGSRATLKARLESRLAAAEAEQAEQAKQIAETQLRLLQAQIEPHFLFNTLSNVTSMVRSDPAAAERTLENLSHLLRNSLRRTRQARTSLGEELDVLKAYLEIQSIRMGDRLRYEIRVADALRDTPLPPMLLQPLVENALQHGIEPAEGGGQVAIDVEREADTLVCRVTDTGVGFDTNRVGNGVGLANVRERLRALHGDTAALSLRDNPEGGVIAELRLPVTR